MLKDKTLLVTGGTGSFGEAVVRRALAEEAAEVRIFSRDEKKQDDLRHALADPRLRFIIGDVRDYDSLAQAMVETDLVFHAAALKQVPSCEFHPFEAVRTNVLGTENVLNAAIAARASHVTVLSTDKAVYPIAAMGLTKALGEKLTIAKAKAPGKHKPVMSTARYGNVMASRGSVIPLFVKQIKQGKPLTLTDPDMTRFMMSLADSVDLVLFTYEHARPGDIFVQKAPAATIGALARALCEIFGARPAIRVIGARHGEKAFEHLVAREETCRAEDLGGHFRISADERDLNYASSDRNGGDNGLAEGFTSRSTHQLTDSELIERLLGLAYIQAELTSKAVVSEGD
ncbi:MAG TPA: polysaccharide biosynthesis protein [Caulobacteraceae bacterium]|jgi:UDP-glucose 4-epimerase|nr:polysaccharide biosynthesis protein [Caulobacteraceae bacterium]